MAPGGGPGGGASSRAARERMGASGQSPVATPHPVLAPHAETPAPAPWRPPPAANGAANGAVNGAANGTANGSAKGAANGKANGAFVEGADAALDYSDPGSPSSDKAFTPEQIPNSPYGRAGRPALVSPSTPPAVRGLSLPARAAEAQPEGEAPEETPRFGGEALELQASGAAPAGQPAPRGQAASAQNVQYGWEATPPYELQKPGAAAVTELQPELLYEGDEYSDYDDDDGAAYTGPVEHHVL